MISIAGKKKTYQEFTPVCWNEITIEPGLKIMTDDLWKPNQEIEPLIPASENFWEESI